MGNVGLGFTTAIIILLYIPLEMIVSWLFNNKIYKISTNKQVEAAKFGFWATIFHSGAIVLSLTASTFLVEGFNEYVILWFPLTTVLSMAIGNYISTRWILKIGEK